MNPLKKYTEAGRSMVEILGVLALIGLITTGGMYGYTHAMNKHKANEITNNIQLHLPAIYEAFSKEIDPEGYEENVAGAEVDLSQYGNEDFLPRSTDKKFQINVKKLSPALCKKFISSMSEGKTGIHSIEGDINCDKEFNKLEVVYNADLSSNCEPGQGRQSGLCKPCEEGLMSDGTSDCGKCEPGYKANETQTGCIPCKEGDTCGCEKKSDGLGGCTDCVKNNDCDSNNMCYSGFCYSCPKYATCDPEGKSFICEDGYEASGKICCPKNAGCSTNDKGELIVSCSKGYYYQKEESGEKCSPCPTNASCSGGQETFECEDGYEMQNGGCCPSGAECAINENGEYKVISCPEGTYLSNGNCLTCPSNASCSGGKTGFECNSSYQANAEGTACECPAGYHECKGECYADCTGEKQSGKWDTNSCACLCKKELGSTSQSCGCPTGSTYLNGTCVICTSEETCGCSGNTPYQNELGSCVACISDDQCGSGKYCDNGDCVNCSEAKPTNGQACHSACGCAEGLDCLNNSCGCANGVWDTSLKSCKTCPIVRILGPADIFSSNQIGGDPIPGNEGCYCPADHPYLYCPASNSVYYRGGICWCLDVKYCRNDSDCPSDYFCPRPVNKDCSLSSEPESGVCLTVTELKSLGNGFYTVANNGVIAMATSQQYASSYFNCKSPQIAEKICKKFGKEVPSYTEKCTASELADNFYPLSRRCNGWAGLIPIVMRGSSSFNTYMFKDQSSTAGKCYFYSMDGSAQIDKENVSSFVDSCYAPRLILCRDKY